MTVTARPKSAGGLRWRRSGEASQPRSASTATNERKAQPPKHSSAHAPSDIGE